MNLSSYFPMQTLASKNKSSVIKGFSHIVKSNLSSAKLKIQSSLTPSSVLNSLQNQPKKQNQNNNFLLKQAATNDQIDTQIENAGGIVLHKLAAYGSLDELKKALWQHFDEIAGIVKKYNSDRYSDLPIEVRNQLYQLKMNKVDFSEFKTWEAIPDGLKKAIINTADDGGKTPLAYAEEYQNIEVQYYLEEMGGVLKDQYDIFSER